MNEDGSTFSVFPLTFTPLEPDKCSCESLEELAKNTESPIEHDCETNELCNGVRCELDVFGTVYHVETILLSCEKPPALDVVVEDELNNPLYAAIFNESGLYWIEVSGRLLPLYATIEHRDYSMDVEVSY